MGKDDSFWSSIESILSNLLSPHCYDELILKQHFFDLGCDKMLLSKILGYAILVGSLLVKFPQIVKIKWNKSGVGVSVFAESIMLAAIFGSMAYGYTSGFPFSAYGDSYFLFIQTILVILLVLYYQRKYLAAVTYLGLLGLEVKSLFLTRHIAIRDEVDTV
jgi:mannose-P-dolichol utilization defect protein 1